MLEIQKAKSYLRSRLRAHGATDEEIEQAAPTPPFRPAFVNGKRVERSKPTAAADTGYEVPTSQFAFRPKSTEDEGTNQG